MISTLNHIDTEVFLLLNGLHNAFFDFIMYWISNRFIWIPLYAFLIFLIFKNYGNRSWLILLLVALMVTSSDQLTVFMKNYFQRPRPCHQEELQLLVHIVKGHCGGSFGFVSSHAANSFGLAIFLLPFFRNKYRNFALLIISWAAIAAYSRIYLGVHFPGDVLVGSIIGSLLGFLFSRIYFYFYPTLAPKHV